jgi:hypothetical protein
MGFYEYSPLILATMELGDEEDSYKFWLILSETDSSSASTLSSETESDEDTGFW